MEPSTAMLVLGGEVEVRLCESGPGESWVVCRDEDTASGERTMEPGDVI
jgi:hypothetical protein